MTLKKLVTITVLSLLAGWQTLYGQSSLTGKVLNEKQEPVPYATVSLKNTALSAITAEDGSFRFDGIKPGPYIIQFSAYGYRSKADSIDFETGRAVEIAVQSAPLQLDEVVIDATRVDKNKGMAYNNLNAEEIKKQNLGQDAPYALNTLPNVVVNSDAGNGVGYTGIRIRGSDGTRINVTINGVPVNDAESQNTFWVNMPDLLSSANSIQVQRGVGASSNGAGSFGATINFQTNQLNDKPYAGLVSTAGSFDTYRNTLMAGTGLINNKLSLDARVSRITSNGYIDRANSDLNSTYLSAGWYEKKTLIKFINFTGWEKTYQAWYYVPQDSLPVNRTYNSAGKYYDKDSTLRYYENETDNYYQNNSQLHIIHQVNKRLAINLTGHYTRGKGYYEQYKEDQAMADYLISPVTSPFEDTTDLIRRLWLDNHFGGAILNAKYNLNPRLNFTLGGAYHSYFGKHFGRVMWARTAGDSEQDHQYYQNTGNKEDLNFYLKTNYRPVSWLNMFVDLQSRSVIYSFLGYNELLEEQQQKASYSFFNPKIGFNADLSSNLSLYGSYAVANKEPNRDDFVQSSPQSRPKHEELRDIEAGLRYNTTKVSATVNFFNMDYRNQLVLNGQINNVGAYNRVNVPVSFRRGVEIELGYRPFKLVGVAGNVSFSQNKIAEFNEFIDSMDVDFAYFGQNKVEHKNTDISFSPNVVTSAMLTFYPVKGLEVALINKTVSRQYLDNTTNKARSIDPYSVLDLRLNYSIRTRLIPELSFMLAFYNVLSEVYETNGYTYGYYTGASLNTFNFLSPAAPLNIMGGISLKLF